MDTPKRGLDDVRDLFDPDAPELKGVRLHLRIGGHFESGREGAPAHRITTARVFDDGGYCGEVALDTATVKALAEPVGGVVEGDYLYVNVTTTRRTRP